MINIAKKPEFRWNGSKKIFIKKDVLTKDQCIELVKYGVEHNKKGVSKYASSFDISFSSCLLPEDVLIHDSLVSIWDEVIAFYGFDIKHIESYELKQYRCDDFFDTHVDCYYSLHDNLDRKITLSVQLSEVTDYQGGELRILNTKYKLPLGSVICFPSFFPHSVAKVTTGQRWSLVNWAWGPYWR